MQERQNRSPHILNTSANLLGFCFIVLTSVKISKFGHSTIIDESAAVAIIIFMCSCISSFLAMRTIGNRSKKMESVADILFLLGLIVLFVTTLSIAFNSIT